MTEMFYLYAIGSMIGYSLQSVLLLHFARRMDGLTVAMYRGLSLSVMLLPLLYGVSFESYAQVLRLWPYLLASGLLGALYLTTMYTSYALIEIGVSGSLSKASNTLMIVFLGVILFQEKIPTTAFILIGVIIGGCLMLGFRRTSLPTHTPYIQKGVLLSLIAGILLASTNLLFALLARQSDPLIAGYFWELSIALGAVILVGVRQMTRYAQKVQMQLKDYIKLCLASSPTLIGTGLYGLALTHGAVAIVQAINAGTLAVVALLAHILYREKLNRWQWVNITIILMCVGGLRFM